MSEIHCYWGRRGRGKTASQTAVAYKYWQKGRKIISNYWLNFPFEPLPEPNEENWEEFWVKLENALILGDEFWAWFDSRCHGTKLNRMLSVFTNQIRKRGVDMIVTCQEPMLLDLRFRDQVDFWIECTMPVKGRVIGHVCDSQWNYVKSIRLDLTQEIFEKYNTLQVIKPVEWKKKKKEIEKNA